MQHLNIKALFYAGALHDIGKALTDPNVLKKIDGFTVQDMKEMKKHVEYSYRLLRGFYEYTAEIVRLHHYFQENGYGVRMPASKIPFSKNTKTCAPICGIVFTVASLL